MKTRHLAILFTLALLLAFFAGCSVVDGEPEGSSAIPDVDVADVGTVGTEIETESDDKETLRSEETPADTTAKPASTTAKPASTTAKPASTTAKPATTAATTAKPEPDYEIPQMMSAVKEPKAGDDPAKLSGIENVMRIAYVLQYAENYSVDGTGTVKAKGGVINTTQNVKVFKDYSRGVMLQIDITTSDYVNSACQTCYAGGKALLRDASGKSSSWNGRQTAWKTGTPSIFKSLSDYRSSYGLFGYELTNYLLNESTLTSWSAVTKNSNGTYTQTIYPDTSKATPDCAKKMKTVGGLNSTPTFSNIAIKLTFDRNWKILSMHVDETYQAKKTVVISVTTNCTASTDFTYTYGKADISAYNSFFAQYAK